MILSQAVRDLAWAISSPSLIRLDRTPGHVAATVDDDLATPEEDWSMIDAGPLESFLASKKTHRIGVYFEQLVFYWLTRLRRYEAVRRGLQIRRGGRTLGELDFIFRDRSGRLTHVETAVKFYLHLPDSGEGCLIGPNANDTFEKKMRRMLDHQLVLGRQTFPQLDRQVAFVKGRIFYHPTHRPEDTPTALLSPTHLRGVWIGEHELSWLDYQQADFRYQLLHKPNWLAPPQLPAAAAEWMSADALKATLRRTLSLRQRAVQVSISAIQKGNAFETGRLFVVPRTWPHPN